MAKVRQAICPSCEHALELPHTFMQMRWRRLACPFCKTKLEIAPGRAPIFLAALSFLPLLVVSLSRLGSARIQIFLAGALAGGYVIGLIGVIAFWNWESRHPVLKIRQIPRPEIALNLNLKSPGNIRTLQ